MRFWNNDVLRNLDGAIEAILLMLRSEGSPPPHPAPIKETSAKRDVDGGGSEGTAVDVRKSLIAARGDAIGRKWRESGRLIDRARRPGAGSWPGRSAQGEGRCGPVRNSAPGDRSE